MLMLVHIFHNVSLNYLADLITVLGAFYGGYRFFESRQKKNQERRDKEEQDNLVATVNTVVEASVLKIMTGVDSLVEKSVKEELSEVNEKIKHHGEVLHRVEHEVTFNDGSSMKDSQKRTETLLNKIAVGMDALHDGSIRQEQITKQQAGTISKIEERQGETIDTINKVSTNLASHLGAHEGLPGDK